MFEFQKSATLDLVAFFFFCRFHCHLRGRVKTRFAAVFFLWLASIGMVVAASLVPWRSLIGMSRQRCAADLTICRCVWKWLVPLNPMVNDHYPPLKPMVLLIIIPMKNGYFIGNIPYFQTNPFVKVQGSLHGLALAWSCQRLSHGQLFAHTTWALLFVFVQTYQDLRAFPSVKVYSSLHLSNCSRAVWNKYQEKKI